jgi:hypothetical protein
MSRTMIQQIAEAANADAFFSGTVLSSAEVKQLHKEITALTAPTSPKCLTCGSDRRPVCPECMAEVLS